MIKYVRLDCDNCRIKQWTELSDAGFDYYFGEINAGRFPCPTCPKILELKTVDCFDSTEEVYNSYYYRPIK